MNRVLTFLLLLTSVLAYGQSQPYLKAPSYGNSWNRGAFHDGLLIPAYPSVPTTPATFKAMVGDSIRSGAIMINTTTDVLQWWSNGAWRAPAGTGTITSITAGTGLTGGTITSSGVIAMPAVGTPGTYGDGTHFPIVTLDAYGRVTGVTTQLVTGGSVTSFNGRTGVVTPIFGDYSFAQLSSHPITLSGYGIVDAVNTITLGAPNGVATLDATGRLKPTQIPTSLIGAVVYRGVWNATTNAPTLTSGVGTNGDYYIINVAGSTTLDGNSSWGLNDIAIFNGTVWNRIPGTSTSITSVFGRTGTIVAMPGDYTATQVGAVPLSRTITINGITQDMSVNRAWSVLPGTGTVTSVGLVSTDIAIGGAASPITSSGTFTLTLPVINPDIGTWNTLTVNSKGQVTGGTNTSYVTSITGTSNRITIGGTSAIPIVDISSTYVGQTSITTVGDVTTGQWNAATVGELYGGTGQNSYTKGDILFSSALNTLAKLGGNITTTKKFLTQTGDGTNSAAPAWGTISVGDLPSLSGLYVSISDATYAKDVVLNSDGAVFATTTFTTASNTATGTLSLNTQTANYVFAGPTTGSAAVPTFRALVATDIPALAYGTVTSVTSANTAHATIATGTTTPVITIVSAPKLEVAHTIGGVSFDGTSNITVASATGGFTVSGGDLALGANNISSTGSIGSTGSRILKGWFTDLQVTNAISGSVTGNAATATALLNPRTIGGNTFDGTTNITVATATAGFTVSGGNLGIGVNDISCTGSLGSTGSRLTKGWFTDLQVTNAIAGSVTGNAATVTTNANLTGPITSSGNATSIASQTGTGTTFAMSVGPTFTGTVTIPTSFVLGATTVTTTGAQLNYLNAATGTTGTTSTNVVFSTSPTLVTPTLGVATATTINKYTFTPPATGSTLTIADGKTFTSSNTLTITGTDGSSAAFSGGGTVAYIDKTGNFTKAQSGAYTTLTDAATIAWDMSLGNSFKIQLGGNRVWGTPTNVVEGTSGVVDIWQDGTGTRLWPTASWMMQTPGGTAPTLSTGKGTHDQMVYAVQNYATGTASMTIATPCVVTWTGNTLLYGMRVQFTSSGALPTGVSASTTYWVNPTGSNTFNLATSLANLQAGTYVASSGSQSGTHTVTSGIIMYSVNLDEK